MTEHPRLTPDAIRTMSRSDVERALTTTLEEIEDLRRKCEWFQAAAIKAVELLPVSVRA